MSDLPIHRTALSGQSIAEAHGLRLEPLPEGHLLQVIGALDDEALAAGIAGAGLSASSVRKAGYRQWYVAGDDPLSPEQVDAFRAALRDRAYVSDQSHGRVRMAISGKQAGEHLAAWTAVDLHPSAFPVGNAAITLLGHVPAQLSRVSADRFEIAVLRSYAEDLYEALASGFSAKRKGEADAS